MYTLSDLRLAAQSPKSVLREMNRLGHTRMRTQAYNPNGICVFDEDWDNLIILDACRYDRFADRSNLPGTLEHRTSRAGATREFVESNFRGRHLHDTVYLTANSWFQRLRNVIDSEVHKLIDLHMNDPDGRYHSEEFKVVPPEALTERATEAVDEYPNKRLVIHYIQPHHPFMGPIGRKYFKPRTANMNEVINESSDATPRLVRRAYTENLDMVLSSVSDLLPSLPGKTIVSADHGEMLGERHDFVPVRDYGHHNGIYNSVLTKVPWHITENGNRKRIIPEAPEDEAEEVDIALLEQRLADLGYKMGDASAPEVEN
jgi:hypothetical protein